MRDRERSFPLISQVSCVIFLLCYFCLYREFSNLNMLIGYLKINLSQFSLGSLTVSKIIGGGNATIRNGPSGGSEKLSMLAFICRDPTLPSSFIFWRFILKQRGVTLQRFYFVKLKQEA